MSTRRPYDVMIGVAALLLALGQALPALAATQCAPETGQCIGGPFADFWQKK